MAAGLGAARALSRWEVVGSGFAFLSKHVGVVLKELQLNHFTAKSLNQVSLKWAGAPHTAVKLPLPLVHIRSQMLLPWLNASSSQKGFITAVRSYKLFNIKKSATQSPWLRNVINSD